jgi:hypothetical protein
MKIKKSKKKTTRSKKSKKSSNNSQFRSVEEVCEPDMIAFHFWREWHEAKDRNDYNFMFEMTREGSELREQLEPRDKFPEACRRRENRIPGLRDGELMKISLAGPDVAHMFEVIKPRRQTSRNPWTIQRWYMLRGEQGWRLEALHDIEVAPDEVQEHLKTDAFPDVEPPEGFQGYSELEDEDA